MAEMNVELLREKLYKAARALFCIGEVCVDVSKQHISAENAIDKIRNYLYDTDVIGSRFRVDMLIEECIDPVMHNIISNEEAKDWLSQALSERLTDIDRFVYFADKDSLTTHKVSADRIAEAVERTQKYLNK